MKGFTKGGIDEIKRSMNAMIFAYAAVTQITENKKDIQINRKCIDGSKKNIDVSKEKVV